jgi:hypothetical protein
MSLIGSTTATMTVLAIVIMMAFLDTSVLGFSTSHVSRATASVQKAPTIPRRRRSVVDIHRELGPVYSHRAYRMENKTFWKLHSKLALHLINDPYKNDFIYRNWAPNGRIPAATRISCSIRYFAGGSPYDIAIMHGVSHTSVFDSIWMVVDSIHACSDLNIKFPIDHGDQRRLAEAFQRKSAAGFGNCLSCIDGILIWTNKPTEEDCIDAKVGPKKFLCTRKHKFGLNMQACCDADGRFLDVSIRHPGATSDYLSFASSWLYHKLEHTDGFLSPGLAIYGDNA